MKIIKESKLNEKKSLEDTVYDELLDLNVEVYLSNLYDGYRVEVETEEQKEKVKKVAKKHKLETKEMGHKGYTDIHVIIPDEEELKRREKEEKANATPKKELKEDVDDKGLGNAVWNRLYNANREMYKLLKDLAERALDRVEEGEQEIEDAVNDALDDGMIWTKDQWTAYEYYCEMGDNPDIMWEGLFNDVYAVVSKVREEKEETPEEETVEETEEIVEESCKKEVKESVLSEKGKQALKNRR